MLAEKNSGEAKTPKKSIVMILTLRNDTSDGDDRPQQVQNASAQTQTAVAPESSALQTRGMRLMTII